jgi:NAD(P)-dependent dehydrogenase (short-subunit alcohol dehydrogenase family)
MMENVLAGRAAVVTGASRGIGRAVALELARRGLEVVATMRDPRSGRALARDAAATGLTLRVEQLDVTAPDEFVFPDHLGVLVNNAGVRLRYLPVEETSLSDWHETFVTNVFGLAELTRRAIPILRRHGSGVICNVTSASILQPVPFMAVYRASKAAVSALCESLRVELAPFGIRVIEILPGPIGTEMMRDSIMARLPEAVAFEPYRAMAERQHELSAQAMPLVADPADAARAIADAIFATEGPMRRGCDPLSVQQIAHWRTTDDESLATATLDRLLTH